MVFAGTFAVPPVASAEGRVIQLGVYTPRLMFRSSVDRTDYARRLADVLGRVTGLTVHGRAFTRSGDLQMFTRAGRIHVALVDPAVLVSQSNRYELFGIATGPQGPAPAYAVLSYRNDLGINAFKGRRIALVDTGRSEARIASNFAFEGEIDVSKFFGKPLKAADMSVITGWLRTGRADCTLGYASEGRAAGLNVVATLRGMPMPALVAVRGALKAGERRIILRSLGGRGLAVPQVGPMTRLRVAARDIISPIRKAAALEAGSRAVRKAVWAPLPMEQLATDSIAITPRKRYPLPRPVNHWHVPDFPEPR